MLGHKGGIGRDQVLIARTGLRYRLFMPVVINYIRAVPIRSRYMPKESEGQKKKVGKVMHEYKEGDLKSGSGAKVKSRKQAVAIAMHEARVPKKGSRSSQAHH